MDSVLSSTMDFNRGGSMPDRPAHSFKDSVRSYIDFIDRLRDIGLDKEINLPAIAIIGDQSSGKSSVLEAISGVRLPRGTGIVTRCPLVMRLKNSRRGWRCTVSYTSNEQKTLNVDNPEDVEDAIMQAQNELTKSSDDISEEAITLDIASDGVQDLTLIDLPGLIAVPTKGQDSDIPDKIEHLVQKWIQNPETIILAVVPANVDIANTKALKMAAKVDPKHERTLGIITKPDLIDRGTEQQLVEILRNDRSGRTYHLNKGYSVVKCRSQQRIDEGQRWSDALEEERQFFDRSGHFRSLPESLLGVSNLNRKLSRELVSQIKKYLPKLEESVALKRLEMETEFANFGEEIPTDIELKRKHFIQSLMKLIDRVRDECEGEYKFMDEHCTRLYTIVREHYDEFENEVYQKNPELDPAKEIQAIQEYKVKYRGPEFPGFIKYVLLINRAKIYLDQCKAPAKTCLEKSFQAMEKMLVNAVELTFSKYARLADVIKDLMLKLMHEYKVICNERLEEEFDKENIIFTQDRLYLLKRDPMGKSVPAGVTIPKSDTRSHSVSNPLFSDGEEDGEESDKKSSHEDGTKMVTRKVTVENSDPAVNDIFLALIAFVKISQQRMVDNIPLTVTLHMLKKLPEKIRTDATALIASEDVVEMIREGEEAAMRREEHGLRLQKILRAKETLDEMKE